jgi:maltose phosphorylase
LYSTYHGFDPNLNIPCKGLTAEVYHGQVFWDTESYCMPFYIFNNPKAAKNLLLYRYKYLPQACERAEQLDCEGARYPMCTLDGTESCATWQHGDFEIHVSAAVSYAVWLYNKLCDDREFLFNQGIELLMQICRYYAKRGEFSPLNGEFGLYGVMGPDEYHMNVNNNAYTNVMAKKRLLNLLLKL